MMLSRRSFVSCTALCALFPFDNAFSGQTQAILVSEDVWAGTSVQYGGAATTRYVAVVYYNQARELEVAEIDRSTRAIQRKTFSIPFDGWDAHKNTLAWFSEDGALHVGGNMHDTPLVYLRADKPGSLGNLVTQPMVGRDEKHVTYPKFFRDSTGHTFFTYRDGASGDGAWFVNRYVGGGWHRVSEVFARGSSAQHSSAYPSPFYLSSDGYFHVAIVWRKTSDVRTNFAVGYAKTKDFLVWSGPDGRSFHGPVSIDNASIVDEPGEGSGLLNNARVVFADDKPFLVYTKYDAAGLNALFVAEVANARWNVRRVAVAAIRTTLEGGGSITEMPRFQVEAVNGVLAISLSFPGEKSRHLNLSTASLLPTLLAMPPRSHPSFSVPIDIAQDRKDGLKLLSSTIEASAGAFEEAIGKLVWRAHDTNRDRPQAISGPTTIWFLSSSDS